jgi:uncharacterized membrane protein
MSELIVFAFDDDTTAYAMRAALDRLPLRDLLPI